MSHDRNCKIDSRVFRIDQLAHRICKAEHRPDAVKWRRELRKAINELMFAVDTRCDGLETQMSERLADAVRRDGSSLLNEVLRPMMSEAGTTTSQHGQSQEG